MNSSVSAPRRQFASDNYAGICPEAWEAMGKRPMRITPRAMARINWSKEAARGIVSEVFETECEVFFVFTGTSANAHGLVASACAPFEKCALPP